MEFLNALHHNKNFNPFAMKATPLKKMSVLIALISLTTLISNYWISHPSTTPQLENDLVRDIKSKIALFNQVLPEDRLILQTDKPVYEPGDDIWFAAWLRDGASLKPSLKSDIVNVELINPKGGIESGIRLVAKNGKAAGDFGLPDDLPGGIYKLKAYTNWMKNTSDTTCFEKEIQIQDLILPNLKMNLEFNRKAYGPGDDVTATLQLTTNSNQALANAALRWQLQINGQTIQQKEETADEEGMKTIRFKLPSKFTGNDALLNVIIPYNGSNESISRALPIVRNAINLTFYPEGGDLLCGFEGKMAFRALNEFNKPADVEGTVFTGDNQVVSHFSSIHNGMGSFYFTPKKNQNYFARITKPAGITQTVALPQPLERGYGINVRNNQANDLTMNVLSTEAEELSLIAQVRGKVVYATAIQVLPGATEIKLPVNEFPAGVAQLTLFDAKGIARAERLCFVNKHKQLHMSFVLEKEKYLPREKVRLHITVKDEKGMPSPAQLALSVVNDQFLSFADDKSGHLVSELLLQQDLREKVIEPSYYFKANTPQTDAALDALLLTSGWRRFTWEKIMNEELPEIRFKGEKALITGQVINAQTNKGLSNAVLTLPSAGTVSTNENGSFTLKNIDLSKPLLLQVAAKGFATQMIQVNDYTDDLQVVLYDEAMRVYHHMHLKSANMPQAAMALNVQEDREAAAVMEAAPVMNKQVLVKAIPVAKIKHLPKMPGVKPVIGMDEDLMAKRNVAADKKKKDQGFEPDENGPGNYYRARVFPVPHYAKSSDTMQPRNDFRTTIYWNPDIQIGNSGKKTIEFFTSDDITSFRINAQGIANDGLTGMSETLLYTQLPFSLITKTPLELVGEDELQLPVTLVNNTDQPLGGLLSIHTPSCLQLMEKVNAEQTIMPKQSKTLFVHYKVLSQTGEFPFSVKFASCGLQDEFTKTIKVVTKGFPVKHSFSGQEQEKEFEFEMDHVVNGSLKASFTAFPNVVNDLMTGIEGILQEPYGCFEQTSCTAYPNAMVLHYLKSTGTDNTKVLARATELLDRGYKRLTTFETPNKGYEWFGSSPAHEGLTAYGIMEFMDMKKAGQPVDQQMLDRTARWLLNHRDGKGGFEREKRALHDFGRISDEVMNAYIVYALSDAGYTDLEKEFQVSCQEAIRSGDAYQLALMANAAVSMKDSKREKELLKLLLSQQQKDGGFMGSTHSITYSQGQSLGIETTALSILALLHSSESDGMAITKAVGYLVSNRSGSGSFNSTQGTILALKALSTFAEKSKKTQEAGSIQIFIDGKKIRELKYQAGQKEAIVAADLERDIKGEGKHRIKIKYLGVEHPLPYSCSVNWNTTLPQSSNQCQVNLVSTLSSTMASIGETVRLSATIRNTGHKDIPSTLVILQIPSGLSVQPWQLKELQEKHLFDFYEIKSNALTLYYRGMAATSQVDINLDLKAEVAGVFEAPASSAYLYYTNEFKCWSPGQRIHILKSNAK